MATQNAVGPQAVEEAGEGSWGRGGGGGGGWMERKRVEERVGEIIFSYERVTFRK